MATNWKALTPEAKAEINAKRRAKYAADEELRLKEQERQRALSRNQRDHHNAIRSIKAVRRLQDLTPGNSYLGMRLAFLVSQRKERWQQRLQTYRDWDGLWPTPAMRRKAITSMKWLEIERILHPVCSHCGTSNMRSANWRLVLRSDFLCTVPFQEKAYDEVLRRPSLYRLFCLKCASMARLASLYWLFSPYSPRQTGQPFSPGMISGSAYRELDSWLPEMYPPGREALINRIDSGLIRSLSYRIRDIKGYWVPSIIRYKPFYRWVAAEPRILSPETVINYIKEQDSGKTESRYQGSNESSSKESSGAIY